MGSMRSVIVVVFACTWWGQIAAGYDLSDPAEPWSALRVGDVKDVPAPFEALRSEGSRIFMWGRTCELGGLLPIQIENQCAPMFRRPPRVVLSVGGERHVVKSGPAVVTLDRRDRVEWTGTMSVGGVSVSTQGWLEYDGVMRLDLTVSAAKTTRVEYFGLEFPLVPEVARFLHYHTVWGRHGNLPVPENVGDSLEFPWHAMWWLGDHDRGLSVFTENDFDWSGGSSAVRIQRQQDATLLQLNIWTKPRELDSAVTFSIGIHPTPSKPLPRRWQSRYVTFFSDGDQLPGSYVSIWHTNQKFYSYPLPADPDAYREQITRRHEQGKRVCPYFTSAGTSPDAPAVKRHYEDWIRTQANGEPLWVSNSVDGGTSRNVCLCTASTYPDFMIWGMNEFLRTFDVDGLYFDNACPYPCANARHGCGRDGKSSYPIFANRDFFKRMYMLIKRHRPDSNRGVIWQHNSRYMVSPALSFVDIYSDGEQFRFDAHSQPLEDITSEFRAMTFTGRQWGAQPCFLPAMASAKRWLTQWGMAVTLPYGNIMIPAPGWTDFTAQAELLKKRQAFVAASENLHFYRPHELPEWLQVRVEIERDGKLVTGDSVAGAYLNSDDNQMLLVVSNLSDQPGALRLHVAAIRGELGERIEVADALTGAPSLRANADAYLRLSIAAHTCRMLHVYPLK